MRQLLKDIETIEEVKIMVDSFYTKVRSNEFIGPIFNERIGERWAVHLEKMYRFWGTVLLGQNTYAGSPFPPHVTMPINEDHFSIWLALFRETVDELFEGEKAREAKWRADKMATMFISKLNYYKNNSAQPLI